MIPLLHLAQEQSGYVTSDAMEAHRRTHRRDSAEVYGAATFYEMFHFEPVGKYLINVCMTMSCALLGAEQLMHHAEQRLSIKAGGTTADGVFSLHHAECRTACTEAPCLQVNYRYRRRVSTEQLDALIDDLAAGALDGEILHTRDARHGSPAHPRRRAAGAVDPGAGTMPAWLRAAAVEHQA